MLDEWGYSQGAAPKPVFRRSPGSTRVKFVPVRRPLEKKVALPLFSRLLCHIFKVSNAYDAAHKMHEARQTAATEVFMWSTGTKRREFAHRDDITDASAFLLDLPYEGYLPMAQSESRASVLNIACGNDRPRACGGYP
jgi:hypothetical protein